MDLINLNKIQIKPVKTVIIISVLCLMISRVVLVLMVCVGSVRGVFTNRILVLSSLIVLRIVNREGIKIRWRIIIVASFVILLFVILVLCLERIYVILRGMFVVCVC